MICRPEILSTRTRPLLACLAFALAASASAQAADLDIQGSGGGFSRYAVRAEQLVIYDFEPGTVTRAYWLAPWRNRHYFPMTGKRPRLGARRRFDRACRCRTGGRLLSRVVDASIDATFYSRLRTQSTGQGCARNASRGNRRGAGRGYPIRAYRCCAGPIPIAIRCRRGDDSGSAASRSGATVA